MKTEIAKTANNTGLWDYYISLWKDDCTYRGISVNTVSVWEYKLRYLQRYTHVDNPLNVTVANIKNWSNRGVKLETRRSDLNAIRSFCNFLYNAKYLKYPIVEDLPMLSRRKPKRQIIASWKQISESISKHQGENIELMIRLAAEGGLRRNEIARVNSKDIVLNNGNYSLLVHGKGDKERLVPLSISLAQLMLKRPKGWLFPSDDPKHSGEHIIGDTVYRKIKRCTGYPTHALRRMYATHLYNATHNLRIVQELLGHESVDTTQRYIYVSNADVFEALHKLDLYRNRYGILDN